MTHAPDLADRLTEVVGVRGVLRRPAELVVYRSDSVEQASESVQRQPELTYAIARLLARRLSAVTAYLVDIKRQYADTNTHLALMDEVLANIIMMQPAAPTAMGSERKDVPDY